MTAQERNPLTGSARLDRRVDSATVKWEFKRADIAKHLDTEWGRKLIGRGLAAIQDKVRANPVAMGEVLSQLIPPDVRVEAVAVMLLGVWEALKATGALEADQELTVRTPPETASCELRIPLTINHGYRTSTYQGGLLDMDLTFGPIHIAKGEDKQLQAQIAFHMQGAVHEMTLGPSGEIRCASTWEQKLPITLVQQLETTLNALSFLSDAAVTPRYGEATITYRGDFISFEYPPTVSHLRNIVPEEAHKLITLAMRQEGGELDDLLAQYRRSIADTAPESAYTTLWSVVERQAEQTSRSEPLLNDEEFRALEGHVTELISDEQKRKTVLDSIRGLKRETRNQRIASVLAEVMKNRGEFSPTDWYERVVGYHGRRSGFAHGSRVSEEELAEVEREMKELSAIVEAFVERAISRSVVSAQPSSGDNPAAAD